MSSSFSSLAVGVFGGTNRGTDELDSTLPGSKRNGLALMIFSAELAF